MISRNDVAAEQQSDLIVPLYDAFDSQAIDLPTSISVTGSITPARSPDLEVAALFADNFGGRWDKLGFAGPSWKQTKTTNHFLTFVKQHLELPSHATRLGFSNYVLVNGDQMSKAGCADADAHETDLGSLTDEQKAAFIQKVHDSALAMWQFLREHGIPAYREVSRSGKGQHVWIFLDKYYPSLLIRQAMQRVIYGELKWTKALEIFPKESTGETGHFVFAPYHAGDIGLRSKFVDENDQPIPIPENYTFDKTTLDQFDQFTAEFAVPGQVKTSRAVEIVTEERERIDWDTLLEAGYGPQQRHDALVALIGKLVKAKTSKTLAMSLIRQWDKKNDPPMGNDRLQSEGEAAWNDFVAKEKAPAKVVYEDVATLLTEPVIHTPNLVAGWMKAVGLYVLAGEEGAGKTLLTENLSICACLGKEWLGRTVQQGKVLYLDNESEREQFKERVQKMMKGKTLQADTFKILFDAPIMEAKYVEAEIETFKPSLVVIDSFYLATNAKEKDNDALKEILGLLKCLAHKYKCVILVITHFRKGTRYEKLHMDMIVGGGAQNRIVDGNFLMRTSDKDETLRIIKAGKLRSFSSKEKKARLLSFDEETFWFKDEGVVDEEEHMAHIGDPKVVKIDIVAIFKKAGKVDMTRDEIHTIAESLGYSESTIDRAIRSEIGKTISKEKWGSYQLLDAELPKAQPPDKLPEMRDEPEAPDLDTPIPE
jgi:hypothetical protein